MTDTQINAAIADACGWTVELSHLQSGLDVIRAGTRRPLPYYCGDLNAMHEAENHMVGKQFETYALLLGASESGSLFGIRATARQRAEAFLRTIGKWEEVQA